jgi:predicted GNAT family N-acyltransferase
MEIRPVQSEKEWEHARRIRTSVFVDEQGCPPELEWDEHEEASRHLLGYVDGEPVAVARWRTVAVDEKIAAKLERFAVLPDYRGRGLGREMVNFAIEDARSAGFETFVLHAQAHLEAFYRSFSFDQIGDPFFEAGIPHIKMTRSDGGSRMTPAS